MKIECACGTKIAFDVTPEMAQTPVEFVCPNCGLDSSEMVNQMIAQEFAPSRPLVSSSSDTRLLPNRLVAATQEPPAAPQPRVHSGGGGSEPETTGTSRFCAKHPGQRPTHRCLVCRKPICPTCMENFGYVCSALCKNKAGLQGIHVPIYAGQKSLRERRRWRKIGAIAGGIAALLIAILCGWFWFVWFASKPGVVFSFRFDQPASSGQSVLCPGDQIVFLHGGTLARHDIKQKKQIWSHNLLDRERADKAASATLRAMKAAQNKAPADADEGGPLKMPSHEELATSFERMNAADMQLHVNGQNIWVASPEKLVRYDWNSGSPNQQVSVEGGYGTVVARGNELLVFTTDYSGQEMVTRVNMATGESHSDQVKGRIAGLSQPAGTHATDDTSRLVASIQRMSLPQKLALPATLSVQRNQQQAVKEINSQEGDKPASKMVSVPRYSENVTVIPTRNGLVQFSTILLEHKIVARKAMKDPPKKSALSGEVNVTQTLEVANEVLNDMRRQAGDDVVEEDESRYLVSIRRPDVPEASDWRGEAVGPPTLFPLNTVTVLAAGKTITVFDRLNKKLWQSTLNYRIPEHAESIGHDDPAAGQGPCVEHDNTLYVFDEGVLSAFDLATGNAQWRLPSVGIKGLFFDDKGMIYISSTTASPESIKYSRQIDVTSKVSATIVKIEPRTGKILWTVQPGGVVSYLSGKFIYTLESFLPEEDDSPYTVTTGFDAQPFVRIKRINPKNGKVMWEHFQQRGPLDVRFDKNLIHIVFKKEVQVLKYFSM